MRNLDNFTDRIIAFLEKSDERNSAVSDSAARGHCGARDFRGDSGEVQMNNFCYECEGEVCKHGICDCVEVDGHDGYCPQCYEECRLKHEAEVEVAWQENIIGPMLADHDAGQIIRVSDLLGEDSERAEDNFYYLGARVAEMERRRKQQLGIAVALAGSLAVLGVIAVLKALEIL